MTPMGDLTPLGRLLRERREPLGWARAVSETELNERALRGYESGGVMPPLDKALIIARVYGIELEELAEAAMGEPWIRRAPAHANGEGDDLVVAEAAKVLPARPRERRPGPRSRGRRPSGQPSPEG